MFRIALTLLVFLATVPAFAQAVRVNVAQTPVNVTTSTTEVAATKSNRGFLLIENDSDTTIYCSIGRAAVLNEGIRLNASGGSYEMSRGTRNIDVRAVNCIHGGTGNKVMLVTEG